MAMKIMAPALAALLPAKVYHPYSDGSCELDELDGFETGLESTFSEDQVTTGRAAEV